MKTRWSVRYSPSEMMYLEVIAGEVRLWLDHSPGRADRYTFDDVLGGAIDADVTNLFGKSVLEELKATVQEWKANPPKPFDKKADMLRRRREG